MYLSSKGIAKRRVVNIQNVFKIVTTFTDTLHVFQYSLQEGLESNQLKLITYN